MLIDKNIIQDGDILYENAFLQIKMINPNYPFLMMQKNGVVTVPYDRLGNIYLLIKHRPNVGTFYELPRGFVENSEDYKSGAVRELIEETGVTPLGAVPLGKIQPDTGVMNNNVRMFALRVETSSTSTRSHFDEADGDTNKVIRLTRTQIDALITEGNIIDGYTLGGLSSFYAHMDKNELDFGVGSDRDNILASVMCENISTLHSNLSKLRSGNVNNTVLMACAYLLGVVCESARGISGSYKQKHSSVNWNLLCSWDKSISDDVTGLKLDIDKLVKSLVVNLPKVLESTQYLLCKALQEL